MGTRLSIEVFPAGGQTVFERAFHEVDRLEQVMSNWRDDSEVARLNRRGARTSFRCSADLFQAVAAAIDWARETGGAFDPTIEPRVRQLGLRGDDGRLPGRGETSALRRFGAATIAPVGWRLVTMDRPTRSIRFARMGMGLDLGGIGKGIALDAASAILRGEGVSSALLDFGGQVQAFGPGPGGRGWPVGIADPDDRGKAVASLLLRDASLATSGNGERRGPRETGATGHILDPQRGVPADFHGSVVVLSTDGTTADALSTALFVMGPERGLDWAERREVAALYLWRSPQGRLEHRATKPFHERLAVWEDDDVTEAGGGFRARGDPTKQENPCGGGP